MVKLAFVFSPAAVMMMPFTASAGVFSFITDLLGNKEAVASSKSRTSEVVGVLQANVGPASAVSQSSFAGVGGADVIAMVDNSALMQEAGVNGTVADISGTTRSTQISLYVVRSGDTLSQIADMYDVTVNTIVWANNLKGSIREGDELVILPISGVIHKVTKGDTVRSIAAKYKADQDEIIAYNDLTADGDLSVGQSVIIPDGEIVSQASKSAVSSSSGPLYKGYYVRPIDGGTKSQGLHGYNGVDLAAPVGTPIKASASGTVIVARPTGYNGGYGSYVVISHPNGTQTLYAHMSKVTVEQGQSVEQGETIGLLGNSGKSTGPHVHFEIRGATNPF